MGSGSRSVGARPYQSAAERPAGDERPRASPRNCATPRRRGARVPLVKIVVCVKQVPDATAVKRLDDATEPARPLAARARSTPTDVNAVEEALRLKEAEGGEVVVALARAREGARVAAQGARDGCRPRRARLRRRRRRLRPRGDELRARGGARARGGRPRAVRAAVERRRRRRPLGRRRRPAPPADGLAGRRARRSTAASRHRKAPDRVRVRRDPRRRCPPSSPSPTRSTSRATRR